MDKEVKQNFILNFILFGCIIIIAILGGLIIDKISQYNKKITSTIEEQYRKDLKNQLDHTKNEIICDIKNNNVNIWDDDSLRNWFKKNIHGSELQKNLTIVNLGYSVKKDVDILNNTNIDEKVFVDISSFCNGYKPKSISNEMIEKDLIVTAKEISSKYNMSSNTVLEALNSIYFKKNNILFESPNMIDPQTNFYKNFMNIYTNNVNSDKLTIYNENGTIEWVEYITIPDTNFGFFNEPYAYDGIENVCYKKLLIIVSIDANTILKPYDNLIRNVNILKILFYIMLVVLLVFSVTIICNKFYHLGGGVGAKCGRCNSDYFDELTNIILKELKQLRN